MNAALPLLASLELIAPEPWRTLGLIIPLTFALGLLAAVIFLHRIAARPSHKATPLLRAPEDASTPVRALPRDV